MLFQAEIVPKFWLLNRPQSPAETSSGGARKYFFDPYTHFRPADADENGSDGDDDIVHR